MTAKEKEDIVKQIEQEADKILMKEVKKIVVDMNRLNRDVIFEFYEDYTPHIYERKFGMFGLSELCHANIKKIDNDNEYGYRITYDYSPDLIVGHSGNEEVIFNGPFEQGYHGGPDSKYGRVIGAPPIAQMSPSPWEIISRYAIEKYDAIID